jgi:hypothetical protein
MGENKCCGMVPEESWDPPFKWTTFELMLEAFVEMVEQNRIIALPRDPRSPDAPLNEINGEDDPEVFPPWSLGTDDEYVVNITIAAWNGLLSAIRSRLPVAEAQDESQEAHYSFEAIEACNIHGCFLKKFLQRAALPSFKFIAPGLRIASSDELAAQPFKELNLSNLRPHYNMAGKSSAC